MPVHQVMPDWLALNLPTAGKEGAAVRTDDQYIEFDSTFLESGLETCMLGNDVFLWVGLDERFECQKNSTSSLKAIEKFPH
jgi:hypothetical protein